ncbi:hypothetical protein ACHQM5_018717 [Ranunculus cassubicifolius]
MASMMDKAKNFVAEKVAHIKKPEAELTDVDLKKVSRDSARFKSQIDVTNPYDHSIPICDIQYSLNGVTALDVDMKVPYSVLVDLARDVGADWDIDYLLSVKFVVDLPVLGNFTIPLEKKGELKLPSLSSIF